MSGNRVEKLEAKVRKLEATVEGLTDELVETKERLEAVEDETGVEPDVFENHRSGRDRSEEAEQSADAETTAEEGETEAAEEAEGTTESESGDDIIVA